MLDLSFMYNACSQPNCVLSCSCFCIVYTWHKVYISILPNRLIENLLSATIQFAQLQSCLMLCSCLALGFVPDIDCTYTVLLHGMQGIPKVQAFRPYLGVASTLLARTLFTMCSYTCITAAATSLGTPQAAAHQVTLQLFWFLSCKLHI